MGASAGSNIAAPTIKTTNDMPIVQPPSFEALGLLGFQLNPHYLDAETSSRHMGETREDRLREYLEDNETPVLGVREGGWLEVTFSVPDISESNFRYSVGRRYLVIWSDRTHPIQHHFVGLPKAVDPKDHMLRFTNGVVDARIRLA